MEAFGLQNIHMYVKPQTNRQPRVGIQVRLKWCAIDYYLIFRHIRTSEIGQNLLTNLRQPRRIYAHNCNYDGLECQPSLLSKAQQGGNCWKVHRRNEYCENYQDPQSEAKVAGLAFKSVLNGAQLITI